MAITKIQGITFHQIIEWKLFVSFSFEVERRNDVISKIGFTEEARIIFPGRVQEHARINRTLSTLHIHPFD